MKKLFFLSILIQVIAMNALQAQRKVELRILSKVLHLSANDSQFIINGEGVSDTFRITKKANERNYKLVNELDKDVISSILVIDKDEVNEKLEGPFPEIPAIDKIINLTAATSEGVMLLPTEDGGRSAVGDEEIGGQIPDQESSDPKPINWKHTAISLLVGAMIGAIIVAVSKRKPYVEDAIETVKSDEEDAFEQAIEPVKNDPKKITVAAKEKIQKLQEDKKALQTERKQLKVELEQLKDQLSQTTQFSKAYYGNVMKEIITPMNDALEKGEHANAMEYLLRMSAHYTSITRHELGMKQAYDSINIANMLKQQSAPPAIVETVDGSTPPDRIPATIRNVMDLMKTNGANTLDNTVIFGYKINA